MSSKASTTLVSDLAGIVADPARGIVSLVGDSGGLTRITGEIYPSNVMTGMLAVETEHGTLYLDPNAEITISEDDGQPANPLLQNDERDLEIGIWPAHPDMAADGGPEAIVVQIDTGKLTGRLRVNVNEAAVWDGNPNTDAAPGTFFNTDPDVTPLIPITEAREALKTVFLINPAFLRKEILEGSIGQRLGEPVRTWISNASDETLRELLDGAVSVDNEAFQQGVNAMILEAIQIAQNHYGAPATE